MTQNDHDRPNAKPPRPPLEPATLRALALRYVGRYLTTQSRLRTFLVRKLRERGWHGDDDDGNQSALAAIEALITDCVALGYVDDAAFGTARAASLKRRGLGSSRVKQALWQAGIEPAQVTKIVADTADDALGTAIMLAKRKRIGRSLEASSDPVAIRRAHNRGFAALIRGGHSPAIAAKVMQMTGFDIDNYVNGTNTDDEVDEPFTQRGED